MISVVQDVDGTKSIMGGYGTGVHAKPMEYHTHPMNVTGLPPPAKDLCIRLMSRITRTGFLNGSVMELQ